ncbi:alkaline phosphatase family protein [Sphingobacterium kitahiroshimense]|uniref:Alkaline phosphatase family protein n=1 Tax=Sphingobacterium kitahiroshimense TaxID=470446 RepID=A0ABV0BR47_9SPHI
MKYLLIFILCVGVCRPSVQASVLEIQDSAHVKKKVLLIGIDGLQFEKINTQSTPNFDAFKIVKAYVGGIVGTPSQQTTGSGPGWMTILTGVWNDKHGVISNDTYNKCKAKTVFQYLKEHNPNSSITSIATWMPIHDFVHGQMRYVDRRYDGGTDEDATKKALDELNINDPDFMFVQYSSPDVIGHGSGYGKDYDESIRAMDTYIGKLTKAVRERVKKNKEEWLIILTTDHGRRGDGHHHGSQTAEEKTVFVGMNVLGNEEFNTTISEVPNKDYDSIYKYPPVTSILPTILTYFNIKIDRDWQLSSPSFIGKEGPRRVMINTQKNAIYWYSTDPGEAKIYKDNQLIATVPAKHGAYPIDPNIDDAPHGYTVMINGQSGSVTRDHFRIIGATNWNDKRRALFIFNNSTYLFYDKVNNKSELGYPKSFSKDFYMGGEEYAEKTEAVLNWDDTSMFMFLNDGRYMRYNLIKNKLEKGYPKDINNNTWPGLEPYKNEIIGAVKMDNKKVYFFLRYGLYIVFDMQRNRTETTYAKEYNEKTLPGLQPYASKISTTTDWSSQYFYIFLKDNTFLRYDKLKNKVMNDVPVVIDDKTWPGLINH